MIDAPIAAAMPCRMVESKPMRDEPVKTDAQTRESPFSRALESAKERTDLPPDTESAVKKRLAQARSETESKSANPVLRRTADADRAPPSAPDASPETLKVTGATSRPVQRPDQSVQTNASELAEKEKQDPATDTTVRVVPAVAPHSPPPSAEVAALTHNWAAPFHGGCVQGDESASSDLPLIEIPDGSLSKTGRPRSASQDAASASASASKSASGSGQIPSESGESTDTFSICHGRSPLAPLRSADTTTVSIAPVELAARAATLSDSPTIKLADTMPPWAMLGTSPAGDTAPAVLSDRLSLPMEAAPGTPAFTDELGADIQLMLRNGFGTAELSLNPVDLGPIHIELKIREQVADISFAVTNPVTREAIEKSLSHLNELLMHKGVSLGSSNVAGDSAGNRQAHGHHAPATGAGHTARPSGVNDGGLISSPGQRRLQIMAAAYARGGIDHYA